MSPAPLMRSGWVRKRGWVRKKILIVEDEKGMTVMLKARLESEGYEVHSAKDGLEGLKKAKTLRPDLILADIMMPKLDGYSMAQRLREDDVTTGIPIIVLSVKETMKDLFQKIGVNCYFTKPFDEAEVLSAIKDILAG